jgi:hypothetical protein
LRYARTFQPDAVFILSAKHGLLDLSEVVAPYDVTLKAMWAADKKAWSERVLSQLQMYADLQRDHFIVLAGDDYCQYLLPHLRSSKRPLQGMPLWRQMQFLKEQLGNA